MKSKDNIIGNNTHVTQISMSEGGVSATVYSDYLTTQEASSYLKRSVSWMLRQKDIPYLRGAPNTYARKDLDDWFEQNKHKPR